jgi:transcription antitermination factor NusG
MSTSGAQLLQDTSATLSLPPHLLVEEARWYAVQTRSRHEKIVDHQLQSQGITTFLPLVTQTHRWSDRKKVVQLPLFPGYTFVKVVPSDEQFFRVCRVYGVSTFVGVRGHGTPIPDKQIADIRALLANNTGCSVCPFLKVGQKVRIRGGCLDGVEGFLVARNGDRNLLISVEPMQRSLAISIHGYDVEAI